MFASGTPDALPDNFTDKAEEFISGLKVVEQRADEPLATLARQMRKRSDGVLTGGTDVDLPAVHQFMRDNGELIGNLFTQASTDCEPGRSVQITIG